MTYQEWIDQQTDVTCRIVTKQMAKEFPELRRVRGHYYCWVWDKREHWWLTNGDEIIDPTASQFPSKGEGRYEEFDDGPEPTGMCLECGEYTFNGEQVHEQCYTAFVGSLI